MVMKEMLNRGYTPDSEWFNPAYRGKHCEPYVYPRVEIHTTSEYKSFMLPCGATAPREFLYPEHDDKYLKECLDNLKGKGVYIDEQLCRG